MWGLCMRMLFIYSCGMLLLFLPCDTCIRAGKTNSTRANKKMASNTLCTLQVFLKEIAANVNASFAVDHLKSAIKCVAV